MSDFVSIELPSGSKALFQTAESDLVSLHTGRPSVKDVDKAGARLEAIAEAAEQVCTSLRQRLAPEEITLEIGVALSGEVGWFFAKSAAEGSLKVTLTWKRPLEQEQG